MGVMGEEGEEEEGKGEDGKERDRKTPRAA